MGVQLVRALDLVRRAALAAGNPVGPILAVSYKNHALDEILLDVLAAHPSFRAGGAVVRCGNSEDPRLKPHAERHSAAERAAQDALQVTST